MARSGRDNETWTIDDRSHFLTQFVFDDSITDAFTAPTGQTSSSPSPGAPAPAPPPRPGGATTPTANDTTVGLKLRSANALRTSLGNRSVTSPSRPPNR
jgi:hypothetical protein